MNTEKILNYLRRRTAGDEEVAAADVIERQAAQIEMMREALESCDSGDYSTGDVIYPSFNEHLVEKALSSTPEQSLTEYRNKVIEAFVNEFSRHVGGDGEFWLHELQDFAMNEQP